MNKKIVIRGSYILYNVACYEYQCSRCGSIEYIPQIIAKTFNKLAPDDWCCISQNDDKHYYCRECSIEIGIGL